MYETLANRVLPFELFLKRLLWHFGYATALMVISLGGGMIGFHRLAPMGWLDAFLNASMLLSGMGPVAPFTNDTEKLFAGVYALYSGFAFAAALGILASPVAHRIVHTVHAEKAK